jgi:hypothetical protein
VTEMLGCERVRLALPMGDDVSIFVAALCAGRRDGQSGGLCGAAERGADMWEQSSPAQLRHEPVGASEDLRSQVNAGSQVRGAAAGRPTDARVTV